MVRRVGLFLLALLALCGLPPTTWCSELSESAASAGDAVDAAAEAAAADASSSSGGPPSNNNTESQISSLAEARAQLEGKQETHQYQAEVNRLLDIIINSLYTQREVFLRELISNAVDALEKARFLSIKDHSQAGPEGLELAIRVETDDQQQLLSICDTGVGMSKQELITNLGTVAKSGTSNFLEALAQNNNDVNLIGQFGVGFYSAFLVSDRVTVVSRQLGGEQHIWESSADAKYYISKDPRGNTMERGTCVLLHLKSDATEFLDTNKLKRLMQRYSQFMVYPIYLKVKKTVTEEVPQEEEEEKKEDKDDVEVKDDDTEEKKKPKKTVEKEVYSYERVNEQKALWLRPKEEISESEYKEFYKSLSNDWSEPLLHIHFSAEGEVDFKALLYIPTRPPADVFSQYFGKQTSIKLYVRRVLVADAFDDLLPKYLHFVRGVVDSDDLPLNVSREQLQQHKLLDIISKKIVRKTIDTIRKLYLDGQKEKEELKKKLEGETDDEEARKETEKKIKEPTMFANFYKEFSRSLLLGCYEDDANRNKIAKVLMFRTSKSLDEPVSLEQYVGRMKEGQNNIFYAAGETKEQLLNQPQMQIFKKKDIEVLLLLESMDEPCIQRLDAFDGKRFESIQKGTLSLEDTAEEKKRFKRVAKYYEPLVKYLKEQLGPRVTKVEVSRRLVDAPCAVVGSSWGYSAQMEKIMKSQTFADPMHMQMMRGQKVFEINPNHRLMQHLLAKVKGEEEASSPSSSSSDNNNKNDKKEMGAGKEEKELVEQLFGAAMLASGYEVEKPEELADVLYRGLGARAGIGGDDDPINEDLPLPPEEEGDAKETDKGEGGEDEETLSADDIFSSIKLDAENTQQEDKTQPENVKDEL